MSPLLSPMKAETYPLFNLTKQFSRQPTTEMMAWVAYQKYPTYNFHAPIFYYRFHYCLANWFDMEK